MCLHVMLATSLIFFPYHDDFQNQTQNLLLQANIFPCYYLLLTQTLTENVELVTHNVQEFSHKLSEHGNISVNF